MSESLRNNIIGGVVTGLILLIINWIFNGVIWMAVWDFLKNVPSWILIFLELWVRIWWVLATAGIIYVLYRLLLGSREPTEKEFIREKVPAPYADLGSRELTEKDFIRGKVPAPYADFVTDTFNGMTWTWEWSYNPATKTWSPKDLDAKCNNCLENIERVTAMTLIDGPTIYKLRCKHCDINYGDPLNDDDMKIIRQSIMDEIGRRLKT